MTKLLHVVEGDPPRHREPRPSRARYRAGHRTLGLDVPLAAWEALDARRAAEGKTFSQLLLGALADHDAAIAEVRERARAAEDRLGEVESARQAEIAELRRELAAAGQRAQQQAQAAVASVYEQGRAALAAAYRRGRAEADPAAAQELAYWREAAPALFRWRAQIDELADRVLDYLAERETEPWAGHAHRQYVEAVRQSRAATDRCLDLALEPLRALWPPTASDRGYHQAPTEPAGSPSDHRR